MQKSYERAKQRNSCKHWKEAIRNNQSLKDQNQKRMALLCYDEGKDYVTIFEAGSAINRVYNPHKFG